MFSNEWIYHRRVIELAAQRFPGVPIIVGGEHATAAAAYILRSCPGVVACALGEGEETLLEVVQAIEQRHGAGDHRRFDGARPGERRGQAHRAAQAHPRAG